MAKKIKSNEVYEFAASALMLSAAACFAGMISPVVTAAGVVAYGIYKANDKKQKQEENDDVRHFNRNGTQDK